jgi:hypothetical protein
LRASARTRAHGDALLGRRCVRATLEVAACRARGLRHGSVSAARDGPLTRGRTSVAPQC